MAFLGFVGAPPTALNYAAYKAAKLASPALAALFAASEAAAVAAMIGNTAAVLGAGAAGFWIGDQILKGLERPETMPNPGDYYEVGAPTFFTSIVYDYYDNTGIIFQDNVTQGIKNPVKGTFARQNGQGFMFYVLDGDNTEIPLVGTTFPVPGQRIVIKGFIKRPGTDPVTPTKKIPSFTPTTPHRPVPVPTFVPLPGYPSFPITPTPVTTPANDPNEDDKFAEPGVTVKIPELGVQIQYTPAGVRVGRYADNETRLFAPPSPQFPTLPPRAAEEPCPCPEDKGKDDEILCRIKTLQSELLDDGFITTTHFQASARYIEVTSLPDEFYRLEIGVTQKPVNVKTQYYAGGSVKVEWVGWLSWIIGGRKSERIFLQFSDTAFNPPPECQGYAIGMNDGCAASSLALTRKKKDYIDLC